MTVMTAPPVAMSEACEPESGVVAHVISCNVCVDVCDPEGRENIFNHIYTFAVFSQILSLLLPVRSSVFLLSLRSSRLRLWVRGRVEDP